jgi:acyl-CoA thioester hydrolase
MSQAAIFTFPVRVYYEDTDAAGIVYYANYLKFAERARTEWLRALGVEQQRLREESGVGFVVRKVTAAFFAPAKLDDLLTIASEVSDIRKVGLSMRQTISRDDTKLVTLEVDLACVDGKMKPARMPDAVKKALGIGD